MKYIWVQSSSDPSNLNNYNDELYIRYLVSRDRNDYWELVSPFGNVVYLPKFVLPLLSITNSPLKISCFVSFPERPRSFLNDLRERRLRYATEAGKKKSKKGKKQKGEGSNDSEETEDVGRIGKRKNKGEQGRTRTGTTKGGKRVTKAVAAKNLNAALASAKAKLGDDFGADFLKLMAGE